MVTAQPASQQQRQRYVKHKFSLFSAHNARDPESPLLIVVMGQVKNPLFKQVRRAVREINKKVQGTTDRPETKEDMLPEEPAPADISKTFKLQGHNVKNLIIVPLKKPDSSTTTYLLRSETDKSIRITRSTEQGGYETIAKTELNLPYELVSEVLLAVVRDKGENPATVIIDPKES